MAHFSWSAAALVIAAVTLLTLPGSLASAGAGPGGFPSPGAGPSSPIGPNENATLTLEAGHNLSSLFWGTTVSPRARLLPNEGSLTTGTPVSVVVWPGAFAGDDYDPLANDARGVIWTSGNQQTTPSVNESQFVAWCRAINCTAIFQVPGEIDNPSIAADIVVYTVNQTYTGPVWEGGTEVNVTMPGLDFRPAYWEVGNEPALWPFWDEPWGEWNHYQTPDSAQYAHEENAYFLAMDGANRSYRPGIIGLPGIGKASSLDNPSQWIDDVLSLNGPNLSGVATHIYPARTLLSGQNALVQFYDQIGATDDSSLYARVGDFEVPILAACRTYTCGPDANASLPIFITEVGTSLSHSLVRGLQSQFPGGAGNGRRRHTGDEPAQCDGRFVRPVPIGRGHDQRVVQQLRRGSTHLHALHAHLLAPRDGRFPGERHGRLEPLGHRHGRGQRRRSTRSPGRELQPHYERDLWDGVHQSVLVRPGERPPPDVRPGGPGRGLGVERHSAGFQPYRRPDHLGPGDAGPRGDLLRPRSPVQLDPPPPVPRPLRNLQRPGLPRELHRQLDPSGIDSARALVHRRRRLAHVVH